MLIIRIDVDSKIGDIPSQGYLLNVKLIIYRTYMPI